MKLLKKRTKRTIGNILLRKGSSMLIGITVVAMFGIPLIANLTISLCITSLTLIKDFFLDRYFNNKLAQELKRKYK